MSEFYDLYNDEFFIIDSNNLNSLESKLYGFSILDNKIVYDDDDVNNDSNLLGFGSYIHLKNFENKISIYQDLNGTWGLYLYIKKMIILLFLIVF